MQVGSARRGKKEARAGQRGRRDVDQTGFPSLRSVCLALTSLVFSYDFIPPQRFERLQKLLGKSKFYTDFLLKKMQVFLTEMLAFPFTDSILTESRSSNGTEEPDKGSPSEEAR